MAQSFFGPMGKKLFLKCLLPQIFLNNSGSGVVIKDWFVPRVAVQAAL